VTKTVLAGLILFPAFFPARIAAQSEEKSVVSIVQRFFDADATTDVEAARAVMIPEGRFFSVRMNDGRKVVRSFTIQEYLDGLAERKEEVLERMWQPKVLLHEDIAVVWTPYDFHRNGRFSHCGVDSFDLVRTSEGWKISGGIYTVETDRCPESPLGPLK